MVAEADVELIGLNIDLCNLHLARLLVPKYAVFGKKRPSANDDEKL